MKNIDSNPNAALFSEIYYNRKYVPNRIYDKDIAPLLGIRIGTLTRRKKEPGTFRISEFSKLVEYMGWTDQEIISVIRGYESNLVDENDCEDEEIECLDGH